MFASRRTPPTTLILVAVLMVLLPLLAYLQYQWQGQVGKGLRDQTQEQMQRAAAQLREDFDREIARVYDDFQTNSLAGTPPDQRANQLRQDYAALYARWNQAALYPKLVSDVYLIPRWDDAQQAIEHLEPASGKFEATEWPEDFSRLRKSSNVIVRINGGVEKRIEFPPTIDRRIPAVIISIMPAHSPESPIEMPMPMAEVIVKLNLEYIQKEFIPALAKQHLSNSDGSVAYYVSIVDRESPGRVIFSNVVAAPKDAKGDVTSEIFVFPSSPFNQRVFTAPIGFASRDIFEKRGVAGVFSMLQQNTTQHASIAIRDSNSSAWQLALTHKAGSLDAAVAQARNKNLAISFGILVVLALSMGFILVSVQRERRLARQQMEFVSTVSHELRTPLAVIRSAGENLADGVVADAEQTRQYGALIRNEGRRLTEMVEQVLDLAGIQSGKTSYKFEPTEIGELVDRALETFELQIRDNCIALEKRIPASLPPISIDRAAFSRVLQNLIGNALKYGMAGNWLSIRAESTPQSVNIIVEDRGGGISAVDLPHIFEPFYRGRSVVDAQIKGSGLGLALVHQIIEAHGARIHVTNEQGAKFTIENPVG